jgi:RNA polymerase sigma-70 factor, ECF subfamily
MTNGTDPELVARLKKCDAAAFDEVFERYRARLFGFLVRLSGRRDVAEDLLQETWLRLATRVLTLRDDAKLGPWLFTVARNLHSSYRRATLLTTTRLAEFFTHQHGRDEAPSPFENAVRDEHEKRLERALASLPLRYREVLLVAMEGVCQSEGAAVCGLSPAAFRKRLSRARNMMTLRLSRSSQHPARLGDSSSIASDSARGKVP